MCIYLREDAWVDLSIGTLSATFLPDREAGRGGRHRPPFSLQILHGRDNPELDMKGGGFTGPVPGTSEDSEICGGNEPT